MLTVASSNHHSLLRQQAAQEKHEKHALKAHSKKQQINEQMYSTSYTSTDLVKHDQTFIFTLLQLVLYAQRFKQYSDESLCSSLAASLHIVSRTTSLMKNDFLK